MITREDAILIARTRAAEKGWGISEPLTVHNRRNWLGSIRSYDVISNPAMRGTKTKFTIDAETGLILAEGHIQR